MFVLSGYEYFLVFLLISCLVPVAALTASKLLRPISRGPARRTTYESGMEPIGGAWIQFNIRYYMFALVFVIFDVETVFLYPWAVAFSQLGLLAFIEALIFIAILVVGLVYAPPSAANPLSLAPGEKLANPSAPPAVTHGLSENVILTTVDDLYNWCRLSSLFPLLYGTACCFIEFAALIGSRFDFDRFGLLPRASPRQADLLITAGTVTMKMAPALVRLYEQMPDPKYVIAMGACTITGGMFSSDSPSAVRGVDKLIPVDVYIPGCPPRPEAIIDAIIKLRKKVATESMQDRAYTLQTHRFYERSHALKTVPPILTGQYLQMGTHATPPKELLEAMGMPIAEPVAELVPENEEI